MPTRGTIPDSRAQQRECHDVETGDHRVIRVPGPAAAALREQHDRQAPPLDDLEETIFLAMPHTPCVPASTV